MRNSPLVIELRIEIGAVSARRNSIFGDENRVLLRIICLVDVRKNSSEAPRNAKKPARAGLRPFRAAQSIPRAPAIILERDVLIKEKLEDENSWISKAGYR
jgi:hypothetical protein